MLSLSPSSFPYVWLVRFLSACVGRTKILPESGLDQRLRRPLRGLLLVQRTIDGQVYQDYQVYFSALLPSPVSLRDARGCLTDKRENSTTTTTAAAAMTTPPRAPSLCVTTSVCIHGLVHRVGAKRARARNPLLHELLEGLLACCCRPRPTPLVAAPLQ